VLGSAQAYAGRATGETVVPFGDCTERSNVQARSRELDRNKDKHGRYLPHGADDAGWLRRGRPRPHKPVSSPVLRTMRCFRFGLGSGFVPRSRWRLER